MCQPLRVDWYSATLGRVCQPLRVDWYSATLGCVCQPLRVDWYSATLGCVCQPLHVDWYSATLGCVCVNLCMSTGIQPLWAVCQLCRVICSYPVGVCIRGGQGYWRNLNCCHSPYLQMCCQVNGGGRGICMAIGGSYA